MPLTLTTASVGPWPMNTYVITCAATQTSAIVDPGAEPATILALAAGTRVDKILLTHAHPDHVGALEEVRAATGAPVYLHPAEADKFGVPYDIALSGNQVIEIGAEQVRTIHRPGHTPGMIALDLRDGRIIVGDTLFVGGPGRTWSAADFATRAGFGGCDGAVVSGAPVRIATTSLMADSSPAESIAITW